jgi:hypothetical protein
VKSRQKAAGDLRLEKAEGAYDEQDEEKGYAIRSLSGCYSDSGLTVHIAHGDLSQVNPRAKITMRSSLDELLRPRPARS